MSSIDSSMTPVSAPMYESMRNPTPEKRREINKKRMERDLRIVLLKYKTALGPYSHLEEGRVSLRWVGEALVERACKKSELDDCERKIRELEMNFNKLELILQYCLILVVNKQYGKLELIKNGSISVSDRELKKILDQPKPFIIDPIDQEFAKGLREGFEQNKVRMQAELDAAKAERQRLNLVFDKFDQYKQLVRFKTACIAYE